MNDTFLPDSHTPVAVGNLLLVAYEGIHGLDLSDRLSTNWSVGERWVNGYASIIATDDTALVTTDKGDLILIGFDQKSARVLDRVALGDGKISVLSHPAIAGKRLLIRVGREIRCYRLGESIDS